MRSVVFWLVVGMFGAVLPAAAASVSIYNCTDQTIEFKIYDEGDISCAIPADWGNAKFTLSKCGLSFSYQCGGTKCQVSPLGGSGCNFAKMSGTVTVLKGAQNIDGVIHQADQNGWTYFEQGEGAKCTLCQ
jgi:hypothetical protein